jgi:hypothetical protein
MMRLGDFYRLKILSQARLKQVELPRKKAWDSEAMIEPSLFGFRLHTDKDFIELESEEEARFCKIFLEAGLKEVMIPDDADYLRDVLTELEELKVKHDHIINERMDYILSRKKKKELFFSVWSLLMWEEAKPSLKAAGENVQ